MNKKKRETDLPERVSSCLSGQADAIDARMLMRLQQARLEAVAVSKEGSWASRLWQVASDHSVFTAPVAQVSVAVLVAIFSISLLLTPQAQRGLSEMSGTEVQQNSSPALSEMDVLMSNEDMEFLENLEIYEWLVAEYG